MLLMSKSHGHRCNPGLLQRMYLAFRTVASSMRWRVHHRAEQDAGATGNFRVVLSRLLALVLRMCPDTGTRLSTVCDAGQIRGMRAPTARGSRKTAPPGSSVEPYAVKSIPSQDWKTMT